MAECAVEDSHHEGALSHVRLGLQPTSGLGMPWHFTTPLWQTTVWVCDYHLNPPAYEVPPDPLPEGWEPPAYRQPVCCPEGLIVRLVWEGEIVGLEEATAEEIE